MRCPVVEIDNPFFDAGAPSASEVLYPNVGDYAPDDLKFSRRRLRGKIRLKTLWRKVGSLTSQSRISVPTFCLSMGQSQVADGWAHFDTFLARAKRSTSIILRGGSTSCMPFSQPLARLYWFLPTLFMVVLLGIFVIELTLAVINDEYDNAAEAEEERQKPKRRCGPSFMA